MAFVPVEKPIPPGRGRGRFVPVEQIQAQEPDTSPMAGVGPVQEFLTSVGSGMTDIGQGIKQLFGLTDQEAIQAKQKIDRIGGLSGSPSYPYGQFTGKAALAVPSAFVPGANTLPGAMAIGGAIGLAEPVAEGDVAREKLANAMYGSAAGVGGKIAGDLLAGGAAAKLQGAAARNAANQNLNRVKDQTLQEARRLGYKVNPVQANPSIPNRVFEGWAGKITTGQQVSDFNQQVTNRIARNALGLADDTPLTPEVLKTIRQNGWNSYKAINQIPDDFLADRQFVGELRQIIMESKELGKNFPPLANKNLNQFVKGMMQDSFSPKSATEAVKVLRKRASTHFRSMDDPEKRALAFVEKKIANSLDSLIGRNLQRMGRTDLHQQWHQAREMIAKTHTVESALKEGSGNVLAHKLARAYSKGDPITGDLEKAARFAQTFDRATQEIKSSLPGLSPLDFATMAITASGSQPSLAALMMGRPGVRNMITSAPWQRAMTTPRYPNYVNLISAMEALPKYGAPLAATGAQP